MTTTLPADLDFLVAKLHGRRGRLAEAAILDELCRQRSIPDLVRAICPNRQLHSAAELQAWLILQTVEELGEFAAQLTAAGSALMAWLRIRFQIENLKVLARVFSTGRSVEIARQYLVPLPEDLSLDVDGLAGADSVEAFAESVPLAVVREGLAESVSVYHDNPRPIVLEAALDRAYLRELLARTESLPSEARQDAMGISRQEVDTFHLMLVARGRFTYDLAADVLARYHVRGSGVSEGRFERMLAAPNLRRAAHEAVGIVIEKSAWAQVEAGQAAVSAEPAVFEALAWNRFLRLARRAFRHSHMGLGAVVAFTALRRVELANLIRLSEGIRAEMDPEAIRQRLVPIAGEAFDG